MAGKVFSIDVSCSYDGWWRYNAYASLVCYDAESKVIDYVNLVDKIYDIEYKSELRMAPHNYPNPRTTHLQSSPCDHIALYLYIIANTFPESIIVRDSPEFDANLVIKCDGKQLRNLNYSVNQLGGMTITGELIYG